MDLLIPDQLLDLKTRIDEWKQAHPSKTARIPEDLQEQASDFAAQYPKQDLRKILNVSDRWLEKYETKKPSPSKQKTSKAVQAAFFKLPVNMTSQPTQAQLPVSKSQNYRIHLERADGARLTVSLQSEDSSTIFRFCSDFLRG